MKRLAETLTRLQATIEARRGADPKSSYTAKLLADPGYAAKKMGEEAVETVIAAIKADWPLLPVILATGYAELPPDADPLQPRLAKPFRQRDLTQALDDATSGHQPHRVLKFRPR